MNRRQFLTRAIHTAVATSSAGAILGSMQRAHAAALDKGAAGYRALVCIYLSGGNDSYNTLIPTGSAFNTYQQSRQNMAVSQGDILALNGMDYGLHPGMEGLQTLFNNGNAVPLANVGTLLEPVTKAQFESGQVELPAQLFSHSDQSRQWEKGNAARLENRGWLGDVADLLRASNSNQQLSMNLSVSGGNTIQTGVDVLPYAISANGSTGLGIFGWSGNPLAATHEAMLALPQQHALEQQFAQTQQRATANHFMLAQALDDADPITTVFPAENDLAAQLRMVARVISARSELDVSRQTFFVEMGGWDTHDGQLDDHPALLAEFSAAVTAFFAATQELGVENDVTAFTHSDFSRTLTSNGDGTDHAWGGNHWIIGGSVNGGQMYGQYPSLVIDGPDDIGGGRLIPTTGVEQYAATMARWFGVQNSDLGLVFPHLNRFATSYLGFLS